MKYYECCERVRQAYSQIGGGEVGFIPKAITAAIVTLNELADNNSLPDELRNKAALAAANLLMSDFTDDE